MAHITRAWIDLEPELGASVLNVTLDRVEELGDMLGVVDDRWSPEDVFEADGILADEETDNELDELDDLDEDDG